MPVRAMIAIVELNKDGKAATIGWLKAGVHRRGELHERIWEIRLGSVGHGGRVIDCRRIQLHQRGTERVVSVNVDESR